MTSLTPKVIPLPASWESLESPFTLQANTVIVATEETLNVAQHLATFLRLATGFNFPVEREAKDNAVWLELILSLSKEGYELEVTPTGARLRAATNAGLFYAVQTFKQLLPSAIFSPNKVENVTWHIQGIRIADEPRFAWRGLHLDVCRHFMPVAFIKKLLNVMALHKLNTFHWHLTDDQGWRIEIKRYPKLTEVGAWRTETMIGHGLSTLPHQFDNTPHGGFYSQDEVREVVAYAHERHITIVPEIEMPGHAQAAVTAYPELGNTGEKLEVGKIWGVIEHVFNPSEETIQFLQNVLLEVIELFPGKYIHVGGDECPKKEWRESAAAQQRIKDLGLKDEDDLQSYVISRMDSFLHEHGRQLIGWDEILEGGLAPHATVMSWRGQEGGIVAAKAGHDVVMAPTSHVYLDYYQSDQTEQEPLAIGGFTSLEKVYSFEPIPSELNTSEAEHILGAQAQLWTEYVKTPEHAEYMLFPRLCALAEVVWTEKKNHQDFLGRLEGMLERLGALNISYYKHFSKDLSTA
jgi:hexosaminidase